MALALTSGPGCLWAPSMLFEGEKWVLGLSFPSLRKGVGWDHFKGHFEAKISKRQVS